MNRVCCIMNYPTHYRKNIYLSMAEELNCDFYFGDLHSSKLKMIDFTLFKNPPVICHTKKFGKFNWNKGSLKPVFKRSYHSYILTGEQACLSTWVILLINRLLNRKTYLWAHCWHGDETGFKAFHTKIYLRLASGLFLYGNHAKRLLLTEGFKEEKLHVIYNSLDYDKQLEIRKELSPVPVYLNYFGNDLPVVIFTGRLTTEKKIEQLIEAQVKLKKRGLPFNVLLLGDGGETERLKELVQQYQVASHYWFYGACYDEKVIGNLYFNADLTVSPGNVGLTAIHAMSYGCPVIAHHTFTKQGPEFEAIIPGITGDFFEKDNVDSLVEKICIWLSPRDKKVVRRACFQVIDSKYNPNHQIEVLREALR